MLLHMSLRKYDLNFDDELGQLCARAESNFTCVSIYPGLFHAHEPEGLLAGTNDNKNPEHNVEKVGDENDVENAGGATWRNVAFTYNTVYSVKVNAERLLNGEEALMQEGWEGGNLTGSIRTR